MTLYKLLAHQAAVSAERIAVESASGTMTYRQLAHQVNVLASHFARHGVKRGDCVFIELAKSEKAIVALWATLKIGACYVPINTQLPEASIGAIIRNCRPSALVTAIPDESLTLRACREAGLPLKSIVTAGTENDSGNSAVMSWDHLADSEQPDLPFADCLASDRAYILHTSGSTGVPKGVEIPNGAALAFVHWATKAFSVDSRARLCCTSPLHFDLSVFDIFVSVCAGATNVLIPNEYLIFPQSTKLFIEQMKISHLYTVPFLLTQLVNSSVLEQDDLPLLNHLLFAGEVMPVKTLQSLNQLLSHTMLHNLYGPTETNVCSFYSITRQEDPDCDIPIGRPASSAQIYLVDDTHNEVLPGEQGQIAVSGPSVMSGYAGLPQQSASKFIQIKRISGETVQHAYLTGDYGMVGACGNIFFKGRTDEQIKRRGYRIELGEICTAIGAMPEINDFAVIHHLNKMNQSTITCYLVPANAKLSKDDVKTRLLKYIPAYMLPDQYIFIREIPRTTTGKADKRQLIETTLQ